MIQLIKRDSRRNLLALDYVVSYLAQDKGFGSHPSIVNIAGLGCNPTMGFYGTDDWNFMSKFIENWYIWVSRILLTPYNCHHEMEWLSEPVTNQH